MIQILNKYALILLCGALLTALTGTASAEELSPSKKADIEKLMKVTGSARMAEQMGTLMVQTLRQSLSTCRNCTAQTYDVIERETLGLFRERLSTDDGLMDRMLLIYHKHFSQAEVRQLLAFYETPVGKRLIAATPLIAQEGFDAGKEWGQSLGPRFAEPSSSSFRQGQAAHAGDPGPGARHNPVQEIITRINF